MSSTLPRRISRLTVQLWMPAAAKQLPADLMEKTARGCPVYESLGPEVEKVIQFYWAVLPGAAAAGATPGSR
jgi:hypothetical protein